MPGLLSTGQGSLKTSTKQTGQRVSLSRKKVSWNKGTGSKDAQVQYWVYWLTGIEGHSFSFLQPSRTPWNEKWNIPDTIRSVHTSMPSMGAVRILCKSAMAVTDLLLSAIPVPGAFQCFSNLIHTHTHKKKNKQTA